MALRLANRWRRSTHEQGAVVSDRRDEQVVGPARPAGDERRRRGSGGKDREVLGFRRVVGALHGAVGVGSRRPVGAELVDDPSKQRGPEVGRVQERLDGRQRVDAGVGERLDDDELFDGGAVDLADLAHQEVDQIFVRQHDRELVDRNVLTAFEDVDSDDVGAERPDARRDEPECAGSVGKPNPNSESNRGITLHVRHTMAMTVREGVSSTLRVGVFGGTFDPPHTGHVAIAAQAVHSLSLDRLVVTVAGDPYRKRGAVVASATDRLALARLAFADLERAEVDDREIRRDGPTYTVDTIEELRAEHDAEILLILGADAAASLPSWHRASELADLVTVALMARHGETLDAVDGFRCVKFDVVRVDVSSSQLRDRVARAEPIDGLVPAAVIHELRKRRLYTGR